jgi:tetratricopeptide (TPR) repeat protein
MDGAMGLYYNALELDGNNEYAFANLGLIYMKKGDYNKCIEYSSKALALIDGFMNDTKSFQRDNRLEVKVLLRRGKAYE